MPIKKASIRENRKQVITSRKALLGTALTLGLFSLVGCKTETTTTTTGDTGTTTGTTAQSKTIEGDTIKIGHYAAMTGGTASYGKDTDDGVRMAMDEINAAGGVLGKKIEWRR